MKTEAPKLDARSGGDIYAYLARRLALAPKADPMLEALLQICAHFCATVIERLNRAPDKNFLAYLNLLGLTPLPPCAAQAALTFFPVARVPPSTPRIHVPQGTQVAASPTDGGEPVVFETVRPLYLTPARLCAALAVDPLQDACAEHDELITPAGHPAVDAFAATLPRVRRLHLAQSALLDRPGITELRLSVTLDEAAAAQRPCTVTWSVQSAAGPVILTPVQDTTAGLTRSGMLRFESLPALCPQTLLEHEAVWLTCCVKRPRGQDNTEADAGTETGAGPGGLKPGKSSAPADAERLTGGPPAPARPTAGWNRRVEQLSVSARWEGKAPIRKAFFNTTPVDASADFLPFGERPRFADTLYINCDAFVLENALLTLDIELTNPASAGEDAPLPPTHRDGHPVLQWESWTDAGWAPLTCQDDTQALTEHGHVAFRVPATAQRGTVNGEAGAWIRVRLVSGNYGSPPRLDIPRDGNSTAPPALLPDTLAPPAIHAISASYSLQSDELPPELLITDDGLRLVQVRLRNLYGDGGGAAFVPFNTAEPDHPALYLGLGGLPETPTDPLTLDFYFQLAEPSGRRVVRTVRTTGAAYSARWAWHYWNGCDWRECNVADGTAGLRDSGPVTVGFGDDIAICRACTAAGSDLFWLRATWLSPEVAPLRVQHITLNTVAARQTARIENELLGSSNGNPGQTFKAARKPMLGRIQVEVREPGPPTHEDLARLVREEGIDAVRTVRDMQGTAQATWVRWHEMPDWLASGPLDRHYVVDRGAGTLQFGDGILGVIPPAAANNIQLRSYETGGGARGDQPPGTINQLRTAIPFIASVTNLEAAAGGQDVDSVDAVRARGARWLRHRQRAVTAEDYEDLALEASPAVARAKCYGGSDLASKASPGRLRPGTVSLVVVPDSRDDRPRASLELLRKVQTFLNARNASGVDLTVLAADYVAIAIDAEIEPDAVGSASETTAACEAQLAAYLHPLTGGPAGCGWTFGSLPTLAGLRATLEAVPGQPVPRTLRVRTLEERPGLLSSGIFLICPAAPRVRLAAPRPAGI